MIAHAFFASHHRVRNAISFFLIFLLLLLSFAALAHPLSQTAKQARPLLSAPSKPTPQPKPVSQLKVGDVICARDHATGKVEWKQVIHASKRTVASLLKVQLAYVRTGRPAETLVCPLDQSVRLSDGGATPAGRLSIGSSIIPRAGPVCKVKAMFLVRKPGGFLLCDVRIGPLSAANARLLVLSQERQKRSNASFAVYRVPASRMAYATPNSSGGGAFNPFLFQGQQYDPASGDYFLRARYYDPTIGRFLSQDPFDGVDANPISLHRYLYASNDPVNHIDPSGRDDTLVELNIGAIGSEEAESLASEGAVVARQHILSTLKQVIGKRAGFGLLGQQTPILVDESIEYSVPGLAQALRAIGIDALNSTEVLGSGTGDAEITEFARQIGAKVLTNDLGRNVATGGGFQELALVVPARLHTVASVLRYLSTYFSSSFPGL